jgi:hypothetical protein
VRKSCTFLRQCPLWWVLQGWPEASKFQTRWEASVILVKQSRDFDLDVTNSKFTWLLPVHSLWWWILTCTPLFTQALFPVSEICNHPQPYDGEGIN